jgi:hypothetical protein
MALNPQIFLDESAENEPQEGFVIVQTEIEFLQNDGADRIWARGQVCDFVRSVYQARKIKVKEMPAPRSRLRSLLGESADKISPNLLTRTLEILEREKLANVGELLFHLTHDEFWTLPPSLEHAAKFLIVDFDVELLDLAEAQRRVWLNGENDQNLKEIYGRDFKEREVFLQEWLLDDETRKQFGEFPLQLSGKHAEYLGEEIGRRLRASGGAALSEFPRTTPNKKIYAQAILEYFSYNKNRLTADYVAHSRSLLSSIERSQLEKLLPKTARVPLDVSADFQGALRWATEEYLPLRAENNQCEEADALAASFSDWVLENYPKLTNLDRDTSPINLRTFYTVKRLLQEGYWVLWVVVDGLNYLNHQKLLQLLGEKSAHLRVAENSPMFAVLPTITEKAKYGLTSGKFPSENSKRDFDPKRNFLANFPDGVYAGSTGTAKISDGLKRENPTVCYWNYLNIDDCYHDQTDLIFIQHEVDAQIQGLAGKINQLVATARDINRVAVVICSDHGQMTNPCRKLEVDLSGKHTHGRTALEDAAQVFSHPNSAFVKTNDGETVYLNPKNFRLSEPTTLALGSTYFVDLKATAQDGAIGVHGGLYPEEVVVGLAVLMRQPAHKKLTAMIGGNGETGKPGQIILTVDNPNSVVVKPLSLFVENLEIEEHGELLSAKMGAYQNASFEIRLEKFPAAIDGEEFPINGILHYEFVDDGTQEECNVSGKLICKTLYAPKNPSLLNRFKK